MRTFTIIFCAMVAAIACGHGSRSYRLKQPVDSARVHWYMCTEKACGAGYQGKAFLTHCAHEMDKDGACKERKGVRYRYEIKDIKENHQFFAHMILVPSDQVF